MFSLKVNKVERWCNTFPETFQSNVKSRLTGMTVSPGFLEGCRPGGWALASQMSGDPSTPLGTWLPSGASGDRWGVDLQSGDSGTLSQAGALLLGVGTVWLFPRTGGRVGRGASSSPRQELTGDFLTPGGLFLNCLVKLPWWLKW